MKTSDFNFDLPNELIAQFPPEQRGQSRLLHLDSYGKIQDCLFSDLTTFVRPGDIWVFNNTRVIKARLFGEKTSGGKIEVLIERIIDEHHVLAQIRASHAPQADTHLNIAGITVKVIGRKDDFFRLEFKTDETILSLLNRIGELPLPPYINRNAEKNDEARYQTIYADVLGAVAAPTAGLHFNEAMLEQLKSAGAKIAYLTLHVGAGTFQPVRTKNISEHKMHSERYHISEETVALIEEAQTQGHTITAVGTTTLRALESATHNGKLTPGFSETDIFITPGYQFKTVNRLLTNFHLPKSTLLMLVSAFAGTANIKNAYQHAIKEKYRFFSYGDAMLIERPLS